MDLLREDSVATSWSATSAGPQWGLERVRFLLCCLHLTRQRTRENNDCIKSKCIKSKWDIMLIVNGILYPNYM